MKTKKNILIILLACFIVLAAVVPIIVNSIANRDKIEENPSEAIYPVNSRGQTYGSLAESSITETDPDLIKVLDESFDDVTGYVKLDEFNQAMESIKADEQTLIKLNVYDSEGTLLEDVFFEVGN